MALDTGQLTTTLLIGFLGSTHCIGMCGGIVGALTLGMPETAKQRKSRISGYLLAYNLGRVSSYTLAGAIAGAVGQSLFTFIDESQALTFTRIFSGLFLLALGFYLAGWTQALLPIEKLGDQLWKKIKPLGSRFLPIRNLTHAYISGVIWGWLPCGLVYSALVWSLSSKSVIEGALIMLIFGLATIPAMLLTGLSAMKFNQLARNIWLKRVVGGFMIIMAIAHLSGHTLVML